MAAELGAVLALDPGTRRIGVAVSDPERRIALPLEVIDATSDWVGRVEQMVRERQVSEVVIGHPRSLSGERGPAALAAEEMARVLGEKLDIEVRLVDERLTSVEAERALERAGLDSRRRREHVDRSAAAVLLDAYLRGGAAE